MLERLGCRVDVVGNGKEAKNAASKFQYDLILMDCQMPEMDGLTATREIRGLSYPMGTVPIIALTANAFREMKERSLAAGMNDFLTKPVTVDTLMRLLSVASQTLSIGRHQHRCEAPQTESAKSLDDHDIKGRAESIRSKLVELAGIIGQESAEQLITLFHTESEASITNAQVHLKTESMEDLRKAAHRLAGGALGIQRKRIRADVSAARRCRTQW